MTWKWLDNVDIVHLIVDWFIAADKRVFVDMEHTGSWASTEAVWWDAWWIRDEVGRFTVVTGRELVETEDSTDGDRTSVMTV